MEYFFLFLALLPYLFLVFSFLFTLIAKRRPLHPILNLLIEMWILGVLSILFFFVNTGKPDCCSEAALNSAYSTPVIVLYILGVASYFTLTYHEKLFPPIIELFFRSSLFAYLCLDVFLMIQMEGDIFYVFLGCVPVAMLLIQTMFLRNTQYSEDYKVSRLLLPFSETNQIFKWLGQIPILFIGFVPIAFILNGLLILFGQKPDAIVLAFTQTYYQHFSEMDHLCDNVLCGGHYLCSVAANGNKHLVKSNRLGIRHGNLIVCNRQLLVSNAFENIVEEAFPRLHGVIRKNYDLIGDHIHKDYQVYEKKWVSNFIYLIMKPLEWLFVMVIYSTDRSPENRIALQYSGLSKVEIASIRNARQC